MSNYLPPQDIDPHKELEFILTRDREKLESAARRNTALTLEALTEIDPNLVGPAQEIATSGLLWPDTDDPLVVPESSHLLKVQGEEADTNFIWPLVVAGAGLANFYNLIAAEPHTPTAMSHEQLLDSFDNHDIFYETKPCLVRAHAIFPEFMDALRGVALQAGTNERFYQRLIDGYIDPEPGVEQSSTLISARIAYSIMGRLMRPDDRYIQKTLLGDAEPSTTIVDPAHELIA